MTYFELVGRLVAASEPDAAPGHGDMCDSHRALVRAAAEMLREQATELQMLRGPTPIPLDRADVSPLLEMALADSCLNSRWLPTAAAPEGRYR